MLFKSMELLAKDMDPIDKIIEIARYNSDKFCKKGVQSAINTIRSFSGKRCADKLGGSVAVVVCYNHPNFYQSTCAKKAKEAGIETVTHLADKQLKELIKTDPSNLKKACDLVEDILPDKISCKSILSSSPVSPVVPKVEPTPTKESNAPDAIKIVYDQATKDKAEADLRAIISSLKAIKNQFDTIKKVEEYSSTDRPPVALVRGIYDAIIKKEKEMRDLRDLVDENNYSQAAKIAPTLNSVYSLLDQLKEKEESLNEADKLKKEFNLTQSVDEISAAIKELVRDVDEYWFSDSAARAIRGTLIILKTPQQREDYFKLGNKIGFKKAELFVFWHRSRPDVLNQLYEKGIEYKF